MWLGYESEATRKHPGNARRTLVGGVSDVLILTLGLLASVLGCLARPCRPEQWAHVMAARSVPAPVPVVEAVQGDAVLEAAPVSEPGFADGLTTAAAA